MCLDGNCRPNASCVKATELGKFTASVQTMSPCGTKPLDHKLHALTRC